MTPDRIFLGGREPTWRDGVAWWLCRALDLERAGRGHEADFARRKAAESRITGYFIGLSFHGGSYSVH